MARLPFKTVDVFTKVPFKGNPVAVILDGSALSAEQMQQIASWTNLSETTFIVPVTQAGADYHVRIFTPGAELPFAGHPTIGTAHALLEAGMIAPKNGVLVQQCKAGLITLNVSDGDDGARSIAFTLPQPAITPLEDAAAAELRALLGVDFKPGMAPLLADVGPRWVVAQLSSAAAVLACTPDLQRMKAQDIKGRHTGVVIFGEHGAGLPHGADIEVRAFAPAHGIGEDPVCGSGNGAVAAYIRHVAERGQSGDIGGFGAQLTASQGQVVGRAGVIGLSIGADAIQVAGNAVTCIDGSLLV
ncbi:MAG: phenazine biosynthesis protein PhzF family [Massilia sp.]|nr:phenazine biosynthesis protein PhzF family [Massilia sp.]